MKWTVGEYRGESMGYLRNYKFRMRVIVNEIGKIKVKKRKEWKWNIEKEEWSWLKVGRWCPKVDESMNHSRPIHLKQFGPLYGPPLPLNERNSFNPWAHHKYATHKIHAWNWPLQTSPSIFLVFLLVYA